MNVKYSLTKVWVALMIVAVIGPVTLVSVWYGTRQYRQQLDATLLIERQANELARNHIESEISRIKSVLENKSDPLSLFIDNVDNEKSLGNVNGLLRLVVEREPSVDAVMVLSQEAQLITAIGRKDDFAQDEVHSTTRAQSVMEQWGATLSAQSPEILIPFSGKHFIDAPGEKGEELIVYLSVPIGQPVKAVLLAKVNARGILEKALGKEHGVGVKKTRDYVVSRQGILLTDIEGSRYQAGDLMTHLEIGRSALIHEEWSSNEPYIGTTNQPVFGALTAIPSLNWAMASEVIVSEITTPIVEKLIYSIGITLLIVLIFILFTVSVIRRTLRPLHDLSSAIGRVSTRDFQLTLQPSKIKEFDLLSNSFTDMATQLQEAEEEAKKQRHVLEKGQEMGLIGTWELDIQTNQLIWTEVNYKLFGLDPKAELNYDIFLDRVHIDDREYLNEQWQRALKGEPYDVEHRINIDGVITWVREKAEIACDDFGEPVYAIGFAQDITNRKEQEGALIRKEEQLRLSQKMDALGKLTGGIAHDYNNMLAVILGYVDVLGAKVEDDTEQTQCVEEIRHAAQRASKLTEKLLAFSSTKGGEANQVDINALLHHERNMLEKTLTVRTKLHFKLEEALWPVWLDAGDLEDAVVNLSINAMHAMEGSGQLTIRTDNEQVSETDTHVLEVPPGDYVLLSFTDTGCGMDHATQERVFEPFFSTKGKQGTGLGLSQVYGFVERSHGAIKVYSELGHGTQIVIYFPRDTEHNEAKDKVNIPTVARDYRGSETILIVDDELALLKLNELALTKQGYRVICTGNAHEALEILENDSVDLLLSDIVMPDMDGYELAALVQEKHPEIKIQLASGFSDDRHANMVDKTLYDNLLHKPYLAQTLIKRIHELLNA